MRPTLLNPLFADVTGLKGVGAAVARQLQRLGITRVVDLLFHLPVSAIERTPVEWLQPVHEGRVVTVEVEVVRHEPGRGRTPTRIIAREKGAPGVNFVNFVYFGDAGHYARRLLPVGATRFVSGRLDRYGSALQIAHPDYVTETLAEIPAREPVYPLTEGLTSRRIAGLVQSALERLPPLPEWIPAPLLAERRWPSFPGALAAVHAATDDGLARERLAFDELLANQLALLLVRQHSRRRRGRNLSSDGRLFAQVQARLPFSLTEAQRRSLAEITADMASGTPMLRLLQGDVGSGKTLVALGAMLAAAEAGVQSALLAPTDLLARQHHAGIASLTADLPVRSALLTARDQGASREKLLADLSAGQVHIAVGTHALFQAAVKFHALGLAVVDEQHRFGVEQRMLLTAKSDIPVHLLAMTATPIPRTLALTAFGEMDVSLLDQKPPGRTVVETRVISVEKKPEVLDAVERHLARGAQAYWVCPSVANGGTADAAAAEGRAVELGSRFDAPIGLVHGQMAAAERDRTMARFASGEIGLLVATTVIEVGVDVPAATLMVIEEAERFGLAQLHQLRGRVGRGTEASTCILLRSAELTETARQRLAILRETENGFVIAEEDLRLRGSGEMLGVRQSGDQTFRLVDLDCSGELLSLARSAADGLMMEREERARDAARALLYLFERDSSVSFLRSG